MTSPNVISSNFPTKYYKCENFDGYYLKVKWLDNEIMGGPKIRPKQLWYKRPSDILVGLGIGDTNISIYQDHVNQWSCYTMTRYQFLRFLDEWFYEVSSGTYELYRTLRRMNLLPKYPHLPEVINWRQEGF